MSPGGSRDSTTPRCPPVSSPVRWTATRLWMNQRGSAAPRAAAGSVGSCRCVVMAPPLDSKEEASLESKTESVNAGASAVLIRGHGARRAGRRRPARHGEHDAPGADLLVGGGEPLVRRAEAA